MSSHSSAEVIASHKLDAGFCTTAHPGFTQLLSDFKDARTLVRALLGEEKRDQVAEPMVL